jgi:GntR family transcriptional regulator
MAEPMYKRVAEDLRGRIESGEIAPGSKLPTEVELMDE